MNPFSRFVQQSRTPIEDADADDRSSEPAIDFYSLFLQHFRKLTDDDPMKVEDIAARLESEKAQVKRGTTDGQIGMLSKPIRYLPESADRRQASFFRNES